MFHTGRSGLVVVLAIGLLEAAVSACGGKDGKKTPGSDASGATSSSTNEAGEGGASTGGVLASLGGSTTGGRRATGGNDNTGGDVVAAGGSALAGGSASGGEGGLAQTGGTNGQPSGGGTVAATGGAGSSSLGGRSGQGGIAGAAAAAGSSNVDCDAAGCGPLWCYEECLSPCGCCECLQGSVDTEGNRCDEGCWLRTAGDVHCQQPWDAGPCDAAIQVYWFNAASNRCEPRTYGGCEGNANRFDSLNFCEQDCASIPGPSDEPLPVVYEFGDNCNGNTLTEADREIVTEFVAAREHELPVDAPCVRVNIMAGNGVCARLTDIVIVDTGVEAFVDYYEYGEMGYLAAHEREIPRDTIISALGELSVALGVDPPQVNWR